MSYDDQSYSEQYTTYRQTGVINPIRFHPYNLPLYEEYRIIPNTVVSESNGRYSISNFGNIIDNSKHCFIHQSIREGGYLSVTLCGKAYVVHRLVLLVFDYRENFRELQVNHIDGNPSNNCIFNLEWSTPKENSNHAMLYGLHKMNGENNPLNKLSENDVREICELIQTGKYFDTEIAKMYGVSYATISDIHKGKLWKEIGRDYNLDSKKYKSLEPNQVHEICKLLEEHKLNMHEIGKMFNTSAENIRSIRDRETWKDISKDYNISTEAIPKKFTEKEIREICELIQTGKYFDTEIAKMYNTTPTQLLGLRKGIIWKDVTKDYDMTVRKKK